MIKNIDNKYSKIAIYLHWIIALLIIINIILGWSAELVPESSIRLAIDTHKSIGISVLGLVLLRILWRLSHQPPPLPNTFHKWELKLAKLGHHGLYAMMLLIPVSGWMHDSAWKDAATHPMSIFYIVPWPRISYIQNLEAGLKEKLHDVFGAFHQWFSIFLVMLFVLHIAAIIKHSYIDKKPIIGRMLP